jgi:hypothetical protein
MPIKFREACIREQAIEDAEMLFDGPGMSSLLEPAFNVSDAGFSFYSATEEDTDSAHSPPVYKYQRNYSRGSSVKEQPTSSFLQLPLHRPFTPSVPLSGPPTPPLAQIVDLSANFPGMPVYPGSSLGSSRGSTPVPGIDRYYTGGCYVSPSPTKLAGKRMMKKEMDSTAGFEKASKGLGVRY